MRTLLSVFILCAAVALLISCDDGLSGPKSSIPAPASIDGKWQPETATTKGYDNNGNVVVDTSMVMKDFMAEMGMETYAEISGLQMFGYTNMLDSNCFVKETTTLEIVNGTYQPADADMYIEPGVEAESYSIQLSGGKLLVETVMRYTEEYPYYSLLPYVRVVSTLIFSPYTGVLPPATWPITVCDVQAWGIMKAPACTLRRPIKAGLP